MIIVDIEQGSPEWLAIRLGLASASRFKDVLSEPRSKADKEAGALSDTAKSYMNSLIAEIITGEQAIITGKPLEWGSEHESSARIEYEFKHDTYVEEIGICIHDNRMIGASPDGFVGADGMIEIKCPYVSANHVKTVINGTPVEHMPQIQGNLWVNGRDWCDFISFDPRVKDDNRLFVERVYRDEAMIKRIESKTLAFAEKMKSVLRSKFGIQWDGVNVQEYI